MLTLNSLDVPMWFEEQEREHQFRAAWEAVQVVRSVEYSLFTFGESVLPYFLVCDRSEPSEALSVTRGDIRITRPLIITPESQRPEFHNFFEDHEGEEVAQFLLARTAAFSNLKLDNESGRTHIVYESMDEAISRINRQLDSEDEDRVAILTAPHHLGGVALLKYAAERVLSSAPSNIQELRERGFLP